MKSKKIPNRKSKSDDPNITDEQIKEEETTIKLMYYIKELVTKHQIYHNKTIYSYFTNLCAHILGSYSRQYPNEKADIHFRFKSTKGLITKLYKSIVLNGVFERNPETKEDVYRYDEISDAFGAKLVVTKTSNPVASNEKEFQKLIKERDERLKRYKNFELFNEKLSMLKYGEDVTVTYKDFFEHCINLITELIQVINPKEEKVIELYKSKIQILKDEMEKHSNTDSLNNNIDDFEIFEDPRFNYEQFLYAFHNKIISPVAMKSIHRNLNRLFYNKGVSQQDQVERDLLDAFNIRIYNHEEKHTSSGHEGLHIDISTPYGKFELQAQTEEEYISDQIGETNAHTNMPGKNVPLLTVPKSLDSIPEGENSEAYYEVIFDEGSRCYLNKSEVQLYNDAVECITAHKGKLSYIKALRQVQREKYSSLDNYKALAMEIPETNSGKKNIEYYFSQLEKKRGKIKKLIFNCVGRPITHISFSDIKNYIVENKKFFPSADGLPIEEENSKN